MWSRPLRPLVGALAANGAVAQMMRADCDVAEGSNSGSGDGSSLLEQADAAAQADKFRIRPPLQFEALKLGVNAGKVNAFDGLRFVVSKQVNLNTAVSHL